MSDFDYLMQQPVPPETFNLVPREEWGALPANGPTEPMTLPLDKVYISMNTDSRRCDTKEECALVCRELQELHRSSGLSDIKWNFLVGSDGYIYEGRGWHVKPTIASTEEEYKDKTLDIAYIGTYNDENLPLEMYGKACDVLVEAVELGYLKIGRFEFYPKNITHPQTKVEGSPTLDIDEGVEPNNEMLSVQKSNSMN